MKLKTLFLLYSETSCVMKGNCKSNDIYHNFHNRISAAKAQYLQISCWQAMQIAKLQNGVAFNVNVKQ